MAIVGVALTAFRDPSSLWANVTFSVAFGALLRTMGGVPT
jgi:hypothetical protein